MSSSKTKARIIIGTSIAGIFAAIIIVVFSTFQPGIASLANQGMPLVQ